MAKIIKKFSDFQSTNEAFSLSSLIGSAGEGLVDVAKGKLVEYLYGYFGVKPESLMGTIITNFVEQVDIAEYPQFISGEINVRDMAPKLADATIETISEMGIDGIATRFKVEDKNGWIYRTLKEMISNQTRQADFRETLVGLWTWVLGGASSGSQSAFPNTTGKNPLTVTPQEAQKLAANPAVQKAAAQSNTNPMDLISSLYGGTPGRGPVTGQ
jgi:hypothetical protein